MVALEVGRPIMSITTRFAPSPTGLLHLGHVHTAIRAHDRARRAGGRFLLRVEDVDIVRCRAEYAQAILDDMTWLGLPWDGLVRVQSECFAAYGAVLEALRGEGMLYPCFCSRADIARASSAPHGPEGAIYPGTCRALSPAERAERVAAGQPHAWRLDMAASLARTGPLSFTEEGEGRLACDPAAFGDVVLGRRDVPASYHLAVTHDDATQGVTLVNRGEDLKAATSVHRLLQALMRWPEPAYAHHRLLIDGSGRRLSNRGGALSVRALREAGYSPEDVRAFAMPEALFSAARGN